MFLLHSQKLIYCVVPGTGSSSNRIAIWNKYEKGDWEQLAMLHKPHIVSMHQWMNMDVHGTLRQTRQVLAESNRLDIWDEYKKIGFVRHPYEWVRCIYQKEVGGVQRYFNINNKQDCNKFIEELPFTPYDWFVDDDGETLLTDIIYRMEDGMKIFCDSLDIEVLHTQRSDYKRIFTPDEEHKELIKKKLHREYKHYPEG